MPTTVVVPDTADVLMLKYIVNQLGQDGGAAPAGGQRLVRLFTNNLTPGKSTVLADVTESTEAGYSAITLTGANWTVASSAGTNSAVYSAQTFSYTTGVTVYGYYVTTTEGTPKLLWLERFSVSPFVLPSDGGEIVITPRFNLN